jgi:tetratricopeptide (TPR) repeat protein
MWRPVANDPFPSPGFGDASILINLAYSARRMGDLAASLQLYREAEAALHGHHWGRAHCLRHLGELARVLGRLDEARAARYEAEQLYRNEIADRLSVANTVRLLAMLEDERSKRREARQLYTLAAIETGLDLSQALDKNERRIAGN